MARPRSRVRPLETPGNRRPREMTVALGQLARGTEPGLQAFSGALLFFRALARYPLRPGSRVLNLAAFSQSTASAAN